MMSKSSYVEGRCHSTQREVDQPDPRGSGRSEVHGCEHSRLRQHRDCQRRGWGHPEVREDGMRRALRIGIRQSQTKKRECQGRRWEGYDEGEQGGRRGKM